jgi:uncharacterized membrane protein HdeD (DUF308 family)
VSVVTGLVIVLIPDLSLETVMRILGALMVLDGLVAMVLSHFRQNKQAGMYTLVPKGVVSLIIGTILVLFPTFLVEVFIFVIGFILLIAGLSQLINQLAGRSVMGFSPILTLISLIAFLSGIVLMARPFESAQTILIFFGVIIALYGAGEIYWSFKLRKFQKQMKPEQPEIVDADYEEIE